MIFHPRSGELSAACSAENRGKRKSHHRRWIRLCVSPAVGGLLAISTALSPPSAWAGARDYDQCVLKHMKGSVSDIAARAILKSCGQLYPGGRRGTLSGTIYEKLSNRLVLGSGIEVVLLRPSVADHVRSVHNASQRSLAALEDVAIKEQVDVELSMLDEIVQRAEEKFGETRRQQKLLEIQLGDAEKAARVVKQKTETAVKKAHNNLSLAQEEISQLASMEQTENSRLAGEQLNADEKYRTERAALQVAIKSAQLALDTATRRIQQEKTKISERHRKVKIIADRQVAHASSAFASARTAVEKGRRAFLINLEREYLRNQVSIHVEIKSEYGFREMCFRIHNKGALVLGDYGFDIIYKGQSLAKNGLPASKALLLGEEVPVTKNKYDEEVRGLLPGMTYKNCSYLGDVHKGDKLRILERLGGLSYASSNWNMVLTDVALARPADILWKKKYSFRDDKTWYFPKVSLAQIFAAKLAAVEVKAGIVDSSVGPPDLKSPAFIAAVQRRLASLGYDPGPPDGKSGQRTRQALKLFQISKGMASNGSLNDATVKALGVDITLHQPSMPRSLSSKDTMRVESENPYLLALASRVASKGELQQARNKNNAQKKRHSKEIADHAQHQEKILAPLRSSLKTAQTAHAALEAPLVKSEELKRIQTALTKAQSAAADARAAIEAAEAEARSSAEIAAAFKPQVDKSTARTEQENRNLSALRIRVADLRAGRGMRYEEIRLQVQSRLDRRRIAEIRETTLKAALEGLKDHIIARNRADPEGRFVFSDLVLGRYVLFATARFSGLGERWWLVPVEVGNRERWDLGTHNAFKKEGLITALGGFLRAVK